MYKTFIPSYSPEKGEYIKESRTAETLKGYMSCGIFFDKDLRLFALGGTKENSYCDNWDIYADKDGNLYSIARTGSGCNNSHFGSVGHVKNLIRQGHFSDELTTYGAQMLQAW